MITGFIVHVISKFRLHPHSLPILVVFFFGTKLEAKYSAMKLICRRFSICRTFRCGMSDFMPKLFFNVWTVTCTLRRNCSAIQSEKSIFFWRWQTNYILRLEHALAKLDIVIWENVLISGFSQVSLMSRRRPNPNPNVNYNESYSKHVVWTRELREFTGEYNLLLNNIHEKIT